MPALQTPANTAHTQEQPCYTAKRFAIKFHPPSLFLEYEAKTEEGPQRRVRVVSNPDFCLQCRSLPRCIP